MVALNAESDQPATGRARVLDAAAQLFVDQGYPATTLRQIATTAGIKAGSIYHHFDSKEALFVAVLHEGMVVMIESFEATEARTTADANTDVLEAHVRAHLGAVFEHGPYTTAHVTSFYTAPPAVRDAVVPRRDAYEEHWQQLLERLLANHKPKELRLHRVLLFGAMNATVEWFDPSGNLSLDELASTLTTQFLHGVHGVTA